MMIMALPSGDTADRSATNCAEREMAEASKSCLASCPESDKVIVMDQIIQRCARAGLATTVEELSMGIWSPCATQCHDRDSVKSPSSS